MRKVLLIFVVTSLLIPLPSVLSQSLSDYVKQVKGDTLVIKDYADMNSMPNSLYWALVLDTVGPPAGRVYELQAGGWYPLSNIPTTSAQHPTVILGSDSRMVATNKDASAAPPLISGYVDMFSHPGGIIANGDLTIRNCALLPAANDGTLGWVFIGNTASSSNLTLVLDNCIMEHTRARFVQIQNPNGTMIFRNCYFLNMNGHPCRRSGGVFDCLSDLDTLLLENCTHIWAQGTLYRFRAYPNSPYTYQFKRTIINHNTFVDCAGSIFMNPGFQSNISVTNNLFVNSNIQSYPGIHSVDMWEQDPDWLPMGLVNVYPDSADVANNTPRKVLCQNNLVYWDSSLANMDSILDANKVNGLTNWRSQMIIMNSRTDSMFHHIGRFNTTPYRYLVTDTWRNQMPHFTDPKDLFTTRLASIKAFALGTVDTNGIVVLPDWRLVNTSPDKFVYPDWPIPVDLSYSDADLQTGGIAGFPLGDLNWFPTQKATWLAQRTAEYAYIQNTLENGGTLGMRESGGRVPDEVVLNQNYPNPFNPTTKIQFSTVNRQLTIVKVFDVLGRDVATLVNEVKEPGTYTVQFDARNLASGVYFYRLQAGSFVETKKLLLVR